MTTSIKNISESDITASNIAVAKLVDKDSNEYPANSFYEKDDRSNLASASTTVLTPGQSGMIHFVLKLVMLLQMGRNQLESHIMEKYLLLIFKI